MNEFSLIDTFFKRSVVQRQDVIYGIGDDAACVRVPANHDLLISTDTLVENLHFPSFWDGYEVAWKAVMVNISDMAAMAAVPCWLSLALTMPQIDKVWLKRFSEGLHEALQKYNIALIGGDTTRGPLSITITIHGLAPVGNAVTRKGAKPGDTIWVSGKLGAGALAVAFYHNEIIASFHQDELLNKLKYPVPRVDLSKILQTYASAAIDISDGLSADLNHICTASGVGAVLNLPAIPVHSLVKLYKSDIAIDFALASGDEYELCFTVPVDKVKQMKAKLDAAGISCYAIGVITEGSGLKAIDANGETHHLLPKGYDHFQERE